MSGSSGGSTKFALQAQLIFRRRAFPAGSLYCDRFLFRFSVDIGNCHCPERNQVDSGHELGAKRWQKLPVPSQELNQHSANAKIEYVIGRRDGALDKQGKDNDLK